MKKRNIAIASTLLAVLLAAGPAMSEEKAKDTTVMAPSGQQQKMRMNATPAQKKMQEAMKKARELNKEVLAQVKAKKMELAEISKAENFDKAAFQAKHEEIQTLMQKMAQDRVQAEADALAGMTAEERASMPMMGRKTGGHRGMEGRGNGQMMKPGMGNMPMQEDNSEPSED